MTWHKAIGFLSTLALFSPVFVILAYKLINYKKYLSIFIYCLFAFVYNLMSEGYITLPGSVQRTFGIVNNLLDAPLMFIFLMLFGISVTQAKKMKILLGIFIGFEIVVLSLYGLSIKAITIIMGPGLLLVFGFALYFFVQTVKRSFFHKKILGKALMASAICFAYGCFFLIYIMHYVMALPDIDDIFLIYFIASIIFCSLLSAGLILESKRQRKLEELLVTRKELISFFADEKKPVIPKESTGQWKLN
jgi:hypothetical protein